MCREDKVMYSVNKLVVLTTFLEVEESENILVYNQIQYHYQQFEVNQNFKIARDSIQFELVELKTVIQVKNPVFCVTVKYVKLFFEVRLTKFLYLGTRNSQISDDQPLSQSPVISERAFTPCSQVILEYLLSLYYQDFVMAKYFQLLKHFLYEIILKN